ncbi:putative transposase [Collimonas sp. OK607]|nr:transposase [Collimonas sp. OK607]SFB36792.1 putative transposase [Collimonas sp. OK607]
MSRYRRSLSAGSTFFFTVVSYRRQPILCDDTFRNALRQSVEMVRAQRPFTIDAWVLLPDHLHCIWTLPEGDADFSTRWRLIKRAVSKTCRHAYHRSDWLNASKLSHRESTIWQRRFWEHQIRDEEDFSNHVDYIHVNPVRHGYVKHVVDWLYSTFHRYLKQGLVSADWTTDADLDIRFE